MITLRNKDERRKKPVVQRRLVGQKRLAELRQLEEVQKGASQVDVSHTKEDTLTFRHQAMYRDTGPVRSSTRNSPIAEY